MEYYWSGFPHLDGLHIRCQDTIGDTKLLPLLMTSLIVIKGPQALVLSNKNLLFFTNNSRH